MPNGSCIFSCGISACEALARRLGKCNNCLASKQAARLACGQRLLVESGDFVRLLPAASEPGKIVGARRPAKNIVAEKIFYPFDELV